MGGVEHCMKTCFKHFLEIDDLTQCKNNRSIYKNSIGIEFYHDFDKMLPLSVQYNSVKKKYARRIERFYESIKEPTLFIRYIQNKNEFLYHIQHWDNTIAYIRKFNHFNNLIFVANDDLFMNNCPFIVFYVKRDENDVVARNFTDENQELKKYLIKHLNIVNKKARKNIFNKIARHCIYKYYSTKGEYHHSKTF